MSIKIQRAHPGEQVELVVEVDNGDGLSVTFEIVTADGSVVAGVAATTRGGTARATWKVDAKDHPLPLEVTFVATCGGGRADSGALTIDPPGRISTPAWVLLESGATSGGGELTLLETTDQLVVSQAPDSRIPYRGWYPGDVIGLVADVCAPDGGPLIGTFDVSFDLQKAEVENSGDYHSVKTYTRTLSAPNGATQVAAKWVMATMGQPPPYQFRFVVSWRRRPGEDATPEELRSPLVSVRA